MKNNRRKRNLYQMAALTLCICQAVNIGDFHKTVIAAEQIEKNISTSTGSVIETENITSGSIIETEDITSGSIIENIDKTTEDAITVTDSAIHSPKEENKGDSDKEEISKDKEEHPKKEPNNKKDLESSNDKITLTLRQKGKKITISWKKNIQAQQYAVYLKEGNNKKHLWKTSSKEQITISLTANIEYTIYVIAMDKNGKKLSKSDKYKLLIPKKVSRIYTCSLGEKEVKITWKESALADKYFVYRKVKTEMGYKKIGQSRKCRYLDKEISYNKNYYYKIVPVITLENRNFTGLETKKTFCNKKIVSTNHQKYSYTEMSKDITELTQKYDGIVHSKIIGKSEDNRNIYDVVIGNPNAEKTMLVVSTLHAREYMASLLCMNQIEYYLEHYYDTIGGSSVSAILNEIAIHYIPMANPDGVTISQFGISYIRDEILRQKLYKMSRGNTSLWKANARGVDLNKNFPYKFKKSDSAGSEGFSGRLAVSESETRAIAELIDKLERNTDLRGAINYHAMGSIIFGDCKPKSPIKAKTKKMYRLARNITGYINAAHYSSLTKSKGTAGNLREYFMYVKEVPSITLEIGRRSCPEPIWEFPSIWSKNSSLVLKEAELLL